LTSNRIEYFAVEPVREGSLFGRHLACETNRSCIALPRLDVDEACPDLDLGRSPGCGTLTTENGECSKMSHAKAIFLFNRQYLMPACNNKQCDYGCEHAVFEALVHGLINSNKNQN
jgi:hypothetical protein